VVNPDAASLSTAMPGDRHSHSSTMHGMKSVGDAYVNWPVLHSTLPNYLAFVKLVMSIDCSHSVSGSGVAKGGKGRRAPP